MSETKGKGNASAMVKKPSPGIRSLCNSIVLQAVTDYIVAFASGIESGPNGTDALERFFKSQWCYMLSGGISPDTLIAAARGRARHYQFQNEHNCRNCKGMKKCQHHAHIAWDEKRKGPMTCPKEAARADTAKKGKGKG